MPIDTGALRGPVIPGYLAKSVAGAVDVTLTPEEARNQTLALSGTITANINVVLPLGADQAGRGYWVKNGTSGAFTVTLKGLLGSGVAVTSTKKVLLIWTGADFEAYTAEL